MIRISVFLAEIKVKGLTNPELFPSPKIAHRSADCSRTIRKNDVIHNRDYFLMRHVMTDKKINECSKTNVNRLKNLTI